jgi:hypothetical protein
MTSEDTTCRQGVPETQRPKEHLIAFSKRYPHAFKLVDAVRAEPGRAGPDWPDWCFLPFGAAYRILYGEELPESPTQVGDAFELAALAACRVTQGIYRLAPELLDEAQEADLDWKIPTDLFSRLPQWCVYVETHGEGSMGMRCAGFFAHLLTGSPDTPQLRLLFDVDDTPESRRITGHPSEEGRPEGRPRLLPFAIDHEATDLREAVAAIASHTATLLSQYWEMPVSEEVLEAARGIDVDRLAFQYLWPMVMLDRVCSPTAQYRNAAIRARWPTNPKPKKTRRGPRLFPPDEPVVWEVR